jgi:hypothetical protein
MTPTQVIALLNSLNVGDLDALRSKLDEARAQCATLGHEEVALVVAEARQALVSGDLRTYRKRVETAVARLGHLR